MRMFRRLLLAAIVAALVVLSLYTFFVLHWSYSEGERAGVIQKFSRKGWVHKTWDGELAMTTVPGTAPVIWLFTVRDDAVAEQLRAVLGKRVGLHYREHRGVPSSWFGDTSYYVDSAREQP